MSEQNEFEQRHATEPELGQEATGNDDVECSKPTEPDGIEVGDPEGRSRTSQVLDLIAGVETQLEQMRNAQTACADEIDSLENRRQDMEARERELTELAGEFEERRSSFDDRARELDSLEARLDERRSEFESSAGELEQRVEEFDRREQDFKSRLAEFDRERADIESSRKQVESDRIALDRDRELFDQERLTLINDRAASEAEVASMKSKADEMDQAFVALDKEREELVARLDDVSTTLQGTEARASSAEERATVLEGEMIDLSGKLQDAASAIEHRDAEIAGQALALEKARSDSDGLQDEHDRLATTLAGRDAEVAETTAALEHARSVTGELQEERASLVSRLAERDAEFEELQGSLSLATERLQSLSNAVAEQAPRLEEGATAVALCRQQEQRMKALNEELSTARSEICRLENTNDPDGMLGNAREELERLRMEIEEMIPVDEHRRVVSSLETRLASAADGGSGDDRVRASLQAELERTRSEFESLSEHAGGFEESLRAAEQKIAGLQEENLRLEQRAEMSGMVADDGNSEDAERLREQAHRLADFAVHLQRRRSRLQGVRSVMDRRRKFAPETVAASSTSIEDDRRNKAVEEDLMRRRHELADLESRMIRRWAGEGSVGVVARITVLVLVLAASCWFGVRWFAPGSVSASALVKAQPVAGEVMDDERGTAWNNWHETIISDKLFAKAVASRLAASPGGFEGGTEAVQSFIADDLTVTRIQPGMLSFQLEGSDRGATLEDLEAVVATLASESQRQMARRGDGARVEVMPRDGRIASLNPVPVTASQVQYAGLAFGGSLGLIGVLGAAVYARLSRSRRLFDENLGIDEAEML